MFVKQKHALLMLFSALFFVLVLSSCSDTRDERHHPLFIKGKNERSRGNCEDAVRSFEKYLKINPYSAKTHTELGILYDDMEMLTRALYHYEMFLEIDKSSESEDAETVRTWAENTRKKYYLKLRETYLETDELKGVQDELLAMRQKNKQYLTFLGKLYKQNKKLKKELAIYRPKSESEKGDSAKGDRYIGTEREFKPRPIRPALRFNKKKDDSVGYYTVKKGDTLSTISRSIYGKTRYYRRIFNANKDILKSESQLQIGQKLNIPVLPVNSGDKQHE